ncbi:MAG: enoyl-CoA hydratase/isomerase family protein [Burkholderiaceae bacterium]
MSNAPSLLFEVSEQVATLTFNNPAKRNVFDGETRDRMADAVRQVRRDPGIRALIITGAGGHFCSGGDLRNIASAGLDTDGWRRRMRSLHEWLHELLTLDRPVIAAVDGAAAGAGFSLAMTADFVLATPRARFCMSFLKVGLVPDLAAFHTLPRIVGVQRAKELMLSARDVDAQEALRLGLVMELHEPQVLQARARAMARSFVGASPTAVSLVKRVLEQSPAAPLSALVEAEVNAQALAASTAEHRQAVQCFLDKQPLPFAWPAQPGA